MLNKFIKSLKSNETSNERGSILAVALIIVTVLTFSVTTITSMSVNLASTTSNEVQDLNEENEAKGKIRLAINQFETYLKDPGTFADFDGYNFLYENNPDDTFGVTVTEETSNIEGLDDQGTVVARAYKFAVTLTDGRTVVMYDYVSDTGVETEAFGTFDYTIATNGDLVMAGGNYESDDFLGSNDTPIKIYGRRIYMSRVAAFLESGTTTQSITSERLSIQPDLTTSTNDDDVKAEIHYNESLEYCATEYCFITNTNNDPITLDTSQYHEFSSQYPEDQGTSGSVYIQDYFGNFVFNTYFAEYMSEQAPGRSNEATILFDSLAEDVYDNSSALRVTERWRRGRFIGYRYNWPNRVDFVDITEFVDFVDFENHLWDERESFVYFGNDPGVYYQYDSNVVGSLPVNEEDREPLEISSSIYMRDTESLVVFGDLYLNGTSTQYIQGDIIVTGNLYMTGGNKDMAGSMIVLGETFINLNENRQILTTDIFHTGWGNSEGYTFLAKDNIHFISNDESHSDSYQSDEIYIFMYTEESIYIDAVNSKLNMSGSLFARALGSETRIGSEIFMDNGTDPLRGIIINSFYGHVRNNGSFSEGDDITSHRFRINVVTSDWLDDFFPIVPEFDSEVIISTGELNFLTSEFTIE